MRFHLAVIAGKLCKAVLSLARSGGAALPGLIAERICPGALSRLAAQCPEGVILIAGTNGKTTTSRLVAAALAEEGPLVHNRSGSNMTRGHVSAFLDRTTWLGRVKARQAVLETDEAVLPRVVSLTRPRYVVLNNLLRDQLDRYGEVDAIARKWLEAFRSDLPAESVLVANADDPNLAYLATQLGRPATAFFGIDDPTVGNGEATATSDAYLSPASGKPLSYATYYLAHLGDYADPDGSFARPPLAYAATEVRLDTEHARSQFALRHAGKVEALSLPLPGLYNTYNALAAAAVLGELGLPMEKIRAALSAAAGAFGRFERLEIEGHSLTFCLIKNPAGATEVVRTVAGDPRPHVLAIAANDNFADGLDVSWYWDARFEEAAQKATSVACAGSRAADMALRLKYAGFPGEVCLLDTPDALLGHVLAGPAEVPVYVLATYTATLELQDALKKRGAKAEYWKE